MTFCPVETHTFFTTSSSSEEAEEFCVDEYAVLCVEESAVLCVEEALFFVLLLCSKEALSADFVLSEEPDLVVVALDVEPDEEGYDLDEAVDRIGDMNKFLEQETNENIPYEESIRRMEKIVG